MAEVSALCAVSEQTDFEGVSNDLCEPPCIGWLLQAREHNVGYQAHRREVPLLPLTARDYANNEVMTKW